MKKSIKSRSLICIMTAALWLATSYPAFGGHIKKIGTSAAAFLRIPVGAKGTAMGGAFTSIADDGSAMFWNPGNVAAQLKRTLFIHHSNWLPGLDFNFAGFSLPLQNIGVVGFHVASLKSEEMDITTLEAPMGTGETFTAASTAVGLTFARSLTNRFSIGANVKYIQERIFHSSATGFAFDVGTMFITPFRDIRLGVDVSNVGTRMRMAGEDLNTYTDIAPTQEGNNDNIVSQLKTDYYDLPIILRIGLSWDLHVSQGSHLTFACDGVNPNDNAQYVNVGMELVTLNDILMLWGGYNELFLQDSDKGLTLGAGLKVPAINGLNMAVSYAYQDFKYLGGVNHVAVEIMF
jgi:hypothetical protein